MINRSVVGHAGTRIRSRRLLARHSPHLLYLTHSLTAHCVGQSQMGREQSMSRAGSIPPPLHSVFALHSRDHRTEPFTLPLSFLRQAEHSWSGSWWREWQRRSRNSHKRGFGGKATVIQSSRSTEEIIQLQGGLQLRSLSRCGLSHRMKTPLYHIHHDKLISSSLTEHFCLNVDLSLIVLPIEPSQLSKWCTL